MAQKQAQKPRRDRQERREDALRPSRYLGHDRDALGVYFLEREAFAIAETQFRRAAWLNPFEPAFKMHWALTLLRLGRDAEARRVLAELLRDAPGYEPAKELWKRHWPDAPPDGAGPPMSAAEPPDREQPPLAGRGGAP